jgi:hypothetical protein
MSKWMRVAALMLLPAMAACSDDSDPIDSDDPAESIVMVRLNIGGQTVEITEAGANRAVDVPRGATSLDATFFNAAGNPVTLSSTSTYALDVVSSNTGRLTFTRTGPFSGTLNGLQTGSATIAVKILHGSHEDFGPRNVTINVLPATEN